MADHFEEIIGLRVAALEARVAAEAESVKEHFAELQNFITFSLTRQTAELRTEFSRDLRRVEQRLDGVEQRLGKLELRFDALELRFDALERRFDGLERRFDGLERRFDGLEQRFDGLEQRLDGLEQRFDGLEQRFDGLDRKVDVHYEAVKLILSDILARLPASRG